MTRKKTDLRLVAGVLSAALLLAGCESMIPTARITDLKQGRTLDVKIPSFNRGGTISGTASDGEAFTGNYAVIPGAPSGQDLISRVISGVAADKGYNQLAWKLDSMPNREEYSATLAGNRGTVIDLVFAVDTKSGHGAGTGKDNKGNEYRIQM